MEDTTTTSAWNSAHISPPPPAPFKTWAAWRRAGRKEAEDRAAATRASAAEQLYGEEEASLAEAGDEIGYADCDLW